MEKLSRNQKKLALSLFKAGVIKFDFKKGWRLKLHEKNPKAPLSPFYVDLRKLQSHLNTKSKAVLALSDLIKKLKYDYIAGVPLAAAALASSLADKVKKPQITPRMDKKTHGEIRAIDGDYKKRKRALVVDDLVTSADSKLEVIKVLEKNGLVVKDIAVLFAREQGGVERLAKKGYKLHSALKIKATLKYYAKVKKITNRELEKVLQYLDAPLG